MNESLWLLLPIVCSERIIFSGVLVTSRVDALMLQEQNKLEEKQFQKCRPKKDFLS